jgi:hypothetical protein
MASLYVSKAGHDYWPGTFAQPFLTIDKANITAVAGDDIFIRSGTWTEPIDPINNGTSDVNRIHYQSYPYETVIIADTVTGANINRDYITVEGIQFDGDNYGSPTMVTWIMITGDHCWIENCTGQYATDYGGIWIEQSASYTRFLGGEFSYKNDTGEVIRIEGNHTVIDGMTLHYAYHNCIGVFSDHPLTQYTVIKNCDLYNPIYRASSWGQPNNLNCYLLFENNKVHDCISGPQEPYIADGIQSNGGLVILRRNQFYDIDGCGVLLDSWPWEYPPGTTGIYKHSRNKLYHNIFVNCGKNLEIEGTNPGIKIRYRHNHDGMAPVGLFPNGTFTQIGIKNNILRGSSRAGIYFEYGAPDDEASPYDIDGNWLDADGDPLFTNPTTHDYTLQAGSPCRNVGVFLTTITSITGSGYNLTLADAGYFHDGWGGIVVPDIIQLEGQTQTAQITAINYTTGQISVNTPLSWTQGDGVALAYEGIAPDIGYMEHPEGSEENIYWGSIPFGLIPASAYEGTAGPPANWLAGWTYRKKCTVQTTYLDAGQSDFPARYNIVNDADIGTGALANGHDIRFTANDGYTVLPYDRRSFAISGGVANGVYFLKTNLAVSPATEIYIYYGHADAPDGNDPENVWTNNYSAVWHLDENGNPYLDATANNNDSTAGTYPAQIAGKANYGQDFETGSSNYISFPDTPTLDLGISDFTISFWIKPESMAYEFMLSKNSEDTPKWLIEFTDGPSLYAYLRDASAHEIYVTSNGTLVTGTWYYVTLHCDHNSETPSMRFFINGLPDSTTVDPSAVLTLDNAAALLMGCSAVPGDYLDGILDEVRISKTHRDDSWIKFEYYNMSEPDAEWTTGAEQTEPEENVFVGSIPFGLIPASAYTQDGIFASPGIPFGLIPASTYSSTFAPIVVPTGEVVEVCVDEVYRIVKITKNMGDMTCEITAVKVSEGSEA